MDTIFDKETCPVIVWPLLDAFFGVGLGRLEIRHLDRSGRPRVEHLDTVLDTAIGE